MKSFTEYLTESKKTFKFKVRIANCDMDDETTDRIESALKQFDLISMSKPKNHPPEDRSIEFPQIGTCEVKDFDIEVNYPTHDAAIQQAVGSVRGLNNVQVRAYTADGYASMIDQAQRIKKGQNKKALLDQEKLEAQDRPDLSLDFIKNLETRKYEFAGDSTQQAKTTNDLPQGNVSPVGTNKNKLPSVGRGAKR
jgi:hypothetical protein